MKINTKATGIFITPAISDYIEKKVGSLNKFFRPTDDVLVNVEVGKTTKHHKSGDYFRAEIRVLVDGESYYVESETEDLYASIDEAKDEIIREMTSNRKKAMHLFKRGALKIKNWLKFGRE